MLQKKIDTYVPETTYAPFIHSLIREKARVNSYSMVHSIQTTLGMSAYEQVSKIIADSKFTSCQIQWKSNLKIAKKRVEKINEIIDEIVNGTRKPNRLKEEKEILSIPNENQIEKKDGQIVDVYISDGEDDYYFDIKTVKPNKANFISHKRLLLTWIARADKSITSAIVFPYNPYHPKKYHRIGYDFMSRNDVLVGSEYWNLLGGKGCYEEILELFETAGKSKWSQLQKKIDGL
jgi:hypothetical protein